MSSFNKLLTIIGGIRRLCLRHVLINSNETSGTMIYFTLKATGVLKVYRAFQSLLKVPNLIDI
jgi:hypothetical protein